MSKPKNDKIKLLVLTPTLECGGAEKYVSTLCNNLDKNIFSITLLVLDNANPFFEIDKTIPVINLNTKKTRKALFKILRQIRVCGPDIVYSTANHLTLLLAIFRFLIPYRIYFAARETSLVSVNHRFAKYPRLYNWLLKAFYKKTDKIICPSNTVQKDLIQHYGITQNQTEVIYTGVAKQTGKAIKTSQTIPRFFSVLRLSPEKGIDKIIDSLALLNFPFEYYIIGEGQNKKEIINRIAQKKLNSKVILSGQKTDPFSGMESADLFLMASAYEGMPNTLIEANNYGIPVVAINNPGGISEVIKDGVNGFLVEEYTAENYAKTIERAMANNFDRELIKAETQNKFSLQSMLSKTENLFLSVLKREIQ